MRTPVMPVAHFATPSFDEANPVLMGIKMAAQLHAQATKNREMQMQEENMPALLQAQLKAAQQKAPYMQAQTGLLSEKTKDMPAILKLQQDRLAFQQQQENRIKNRFNAAYRASQLYGRMTTPDKEVFNAQHPGYVQGLTLAYGQRGFQDILDGKVPDEFSSTQAQPMPNQAQPANQMLQGVNNVSQITPDSAIQSMLRGYQGNVQKQPQQQPQVGLSPGSQITTPYSGSQLYGRMTAHDKEVFNAQHPGYVQGLTQGSPIPGQVQTANQTPQYQPGTISPTGQTGGIQSSFGQTPKQIQQSREASEMQANQKSVGSTVWGRYQNAKIIHSLINDPAITQAFKLLSQYSGLAGKTKAQIQSILNPAQWQKYNTALNQVNTLIGGNIKRLETMPTSDIGVQRGLDYFKSILNTIGSDPKGAFQGFLKGRKILNLDSEKIEATATRLFPEYSIRPNPANQIKMPSFANKQQFQSWYKGLSSSQQSSVRRKLGG